MKALIFGGSGYIARNICTSFSRMETISDTTTDIAMPDAVASTIARFSPDLVINCAAKTDHDATESDEEYWLETLRSNILGAATVARTAARLNVRHVHIRTPFETAGTDDYTASKRAAYMIVSRPEYRTISILPGWLFGGVASRQFDELLVTSFRKGHALDITDNSTCTPTYMPDFCEALETLLLRVPHPGTYVLSASEPATRWEFAREFCAAIGKGPATLGWHPTSHFPEPCKRPVDWSVYGNLPSYKTRMQDFISAVGMRPT